ncbi:MAG: helix-turn-helix transcriptional regulator [Bacteroidales bacterium]|nr:helix-turn-helix transcriptional regulator [Bacteroidales bacterium]
MLCLVPDQDKMEERIRIGTKIRELRQKQKIDAKTLALRAGIDASNLSRIEQGHYSVGLDILAKIANALNAHIELVENSQ